MNKNTVKESRRGRTKKKQLCYNQAKWAWRHTNICFFFFFLFCFVFLFLFLFFVFLVFYIVVLGILPHLALKNPWKLVCKFQWYKQLKALENNRKQRKFSLSIGYIYRKFNTCICKFRLILFDHITINVVIKPVSFWSTVGDVLPRASNLIAWREKHPSTKCKNPPVGSRPIHRNPGGIQGYSPWQMSKAVPPCVRKFVSDEVKCIVSGL